MYARKDVGNATGRQLFAAGLCVFFLLPLAGLQALYCCLLVRVPRRGLQTGAFSGLLCVICAQHKTDLEQNKTPVGKALRASAGKSRRCLLPASAVRHRSEPVQLKVRQGPSGFRGSKEAKRKL